jgi:molecular chaperone HtpG
MQQGTINVQTENIFPIIKKFLYSDHEIFLRELVSNAVDATQKIKTLKEIGESKTDIAKLRVEVILDKTAKTITIRDNGIGMTAEEVDKYINQIAFSGATEFVDKYKDKASANQIIGHFGLGFYSAFMVAAKVELVTKSFKTGSEAVKWTCDGSPNYTLEAATKKNRGTDVILHIADDSVEFLEADRLRSILNKYCRFLPVPIVFGKKKTWIDHPEGEKDENNNIKRVEKEEDDIINNTSPLWTKKPSDLKDGDYEAFYRELYPASFEDPLFHIHINVDYPFNLTGILYFPKLKPNLEVNRNKINLYSNQVFITDNVENIVPDFLMLLHGVIDSPEIPLNVSRSYLQEDSNVKKISSHITKKVADKLSSMFKSNREDFEKKWPDISLFIEYGFLSDDKFAEKAKEFLLFKTTDSQIHTLTEFAEKVKAGQTNKHGKTVMLYTQDSEAHFSFVKAAKERGHEVLVMAGPLTAHFITKLERDYPDYIFARIDSAPLDKLIEKEEAIPAKLNEDEQKALVSVFESAVDKELYRIKAESLSAWEAPVVVSQSEWMRRMKEQQMTGGGGFNMFGSLPDSYDLTVNVNHDLIVRIHEEKDEAQKQNLTKHAVDLALLSAGLLRGEALESFVQRSLNILKD